MSTIEIKQKTKTTTENFLNLLKDSQISFWVDSSGGPSCLCNNSFFGTNPKYYIYGSLNEVYEEQTGETAKWQYGENCFDFIEKKLEEEKHNKDGMFVGYFSYDLFQRSKENSYPDFFFAYFENTIPKSLKAYEPGMFLSLGVTPEGRGPEQGACDAALEGNLKAAGPAVKGTLVSNMTDFEYLAKVKLIKEEITKGNVYQVNLTREYHIENVECRMRNVELDLYLKLREASPNPYGCFFKTPFVTILSSSPEEFLYVEPAVQRNGEVAKRTIRTRPIKGTLPKDIFEIDPKNQAENIMIVDLERNDLGRICEYGSIRAEHLLEIEKYKHLNHVVSTVEGKLKPGISLRQIFEALFPSGSITGAPKISAMKLIDKLEPTKRGAYTGSFGYIKTDGTMNFNILIRTIFSRPIAGSPHHRFVSFNVGGGIVADSNPQSELEEIRLKAKGIISALNIGI